MGRLVTAADLRALLRAHPEAALEAMADVRIAGSWVDSSLIDRWHRPPWRGYIWRDPATGVCRVWDSARRRLICTRPTIAEAQAAADAYLLADGWVLLGGAE